MKTYIYIIHSVVPSYYSSVARALKHAYATNGRSVYTSATMTPAEVNATHSEARKRKAVYLRVAAKAIRQKGVFRPDWASDFPQIKISREELR